MDEEEIHAMLHSIYEVKMTDNGDGTSTAIISFRTKNNLSITEVIPASLMEMFGEMAKSLIPSEELSAMTNNSVIIPDSLEET